MDINTPTKHHNMGHEERSSRNSGSVGSLTSDRIKMLDITRDKPIKVAVRVAVPVRDHPKFNFVGKLLGPKGNSMKRLQEDTMCKMAVLGKGSMRDKKKEDELRAGGDPRYAHLVEDLHVEITTFAAPAEAHARIAYALAEVRRFLVPDYHDDIRQEQMWEMQALTTTQTGELIEQSSPNICMQDNDLTNDEKSINNEIMPLGSGNIMASNGTLPQMSTDPSTPTTTTTVGNPTDGTIQTTLVNTLQVDLSTPSAVAAAIHHQLTTGAASFLKPATITGLTPNQAMLGIPNETDVSAPTIALLEKSGALLHPALRGVKGVNIAGGVTRKRPLLGVPRMNPSKRTVMTLLARAKGAQGLHTARNVGAGRMHEPFQMITSPLILPQHMDESMVTAHKENILPGV